MNKLFSFIFLLLIVCTIENANTTGVYPGKFRHINFEGGGWVTEIYPALYKNVTAPALNQYVLYARTDVGGFTKAQITEKAGQI